MMENTEQATRYKLAEGVYYRRAGDNVYVRNVTTRYDYLFNPMVKDILDILREARTRDELIVELSKSYAVENDGSFSARIDAFLQSMVEKHNVLVVGGERVGDTKILGAEMSAKAFYQRNFKLWDVAFELTYQCNERCRHCYLDEPASNRNRILPFEAWKRAIDQIVEMGCVNVLVTGGEPTLHPDFLKICAYIVKRGMLLDIFTNALAISDELFDAIVALRPNTVSFSLYGGTSAFHDWITQVPGSFERSLKTILMFKCAGVDIWIKSLLFKGHADEYAKLKTIGKRFGITVRCGQFVSDSNSGKSRKDLTADENTLVEYLKCNEKDDPLWDQDNVGKRSPDEPVCGIGLSTLTFRPNGDISPCIPFLTTLGNIDTDTVEDVWENSSELQKLRAMRFGDLSPKCASCEDSGFCSVCLGIAYTEYGRLRPCSYSCWHAKLKHELFDAKSSGGRKTGFP